MKVLYLCHRIPYPPNKGEKIRAFHQLRALSGRHEVDLFTLVDDPADRTYEGALAPYCRRVTTALVRPKLARLRALPFLLTDTPLTLPVFHSAQLKAEVRKALSTERYDRIFVYCSAMAQYVEAVDGIPILVDLVDVDSDKWEQYARFSPFPFSAVYRREGRCLRRYERRVCESAASVIVSTHREAEVLRQVCPTASVHVIPNGVDTAYFQPPAVRPAAPAPAVIFTGDMSYFPNEEAVTFFATEVLPRIRESVPDARFLIVGRNPTAKVQKLENIGGVTVTGFVADVRDYLAQAQVAVAPLSIAAGIQNKILEAMAYGLPVVATKRATQGLSPGVAGVVETGETAGELAAKVAHLLLDSESVRRSGAEGRARVAEDYRWDAALDSLMELLEPPVPA